MGWLAQCDFCKRTSVVLYPHDILFIMQRGDNPFPSDVIGIDHVQGWYGQFRVDELRYRFCCPLCAERRKGLTKSSLDAWRADWENDAP